MSDTEPLYPREALETYLQLSARAQDAQRVRLLGDLIDIVFFAGLEREESSPTRVRVVYHDQGIDGLELVQESRFIGGARGDMPAWHILPFERATSVTELGVKALAKIAPAANLPRTAVVVGPHAGRLVIQGIARRVEHTYFPAKGEEETFILSTSKPGHVALWVNGQEVFRYESGASVDLPRRPILFKLLNEEESVIRSVLLGLCARGMNELPAPSWVHGDHYSLFVRVFIGLVERMTAGGHGGLIALLPPSIDPEKEAAAGKYRFPLARRRILLAKIAELVKSRSHSERLAVQRSSPGAQSTEDDSFDLAVAEDDEVMAQNELDALIDNIGQLSVLDNALLLGPDAEILCAGYPVLLTNEPPQVREATSLRGDQSSPFSLMPFGSRHRAAASFAYRFPGGLAFLSSQDGDLRCMHRPVDKDYVLLWNLSPLEW